MPGSAINPFERKVGGLDAIDVREYGAIFDNTADDTAAIQAALDAAVLSNFGGGGNSTDWPARVVLMPAGRAKITSPLEISSNTQLQGVGSGSTILDNRSATPAIQLKVGTAVQTCLRDFQIVNQDNSAVGIDIAQAGFASVLGDAAHIIENVIVVAGLSALHVSGVTEMRIDNFLAYRQTPPVGDASVYLGGSDLMVERVTVAQVQYEGGGLAGSGMRSQLSNTRFVNCKIFGGNANGTSQFQEPAFRLVGQRNQIIGLEIQDYPGWGLEDDQGLNSWQGFVIDSCLDGAIFDCAFGPVTATGGHMVNRGGVFTLAHALNLANGKGASVDCLVTSVANDFNPGQDGTGNYVTINGVLQP